MDESSLRKRKVRIDQSRSDRELVNRHAKIWYFHDAGKAHKRMGQIGENR